MKNLFLLFSIVLWAGTLGGCAISPASVDGMVIQHVDTQKYNGNSALKGNISVGHVTEGKEINPKWESEISDRNLKDALEQSLMRVRMLNRNTATSEYILDASLTKVEWSFNKLDMTTNTTIQYELIEKLSGKRIY